MLLSLTRAYRRGERIIVNLGTVTYAEPCSVTYGAGDSVRLLGTRIYFVNGERVEVTNTFDVLEQMLDPEARLEELNQHVIDRKQVA